MKLVNVIPAHSAVLNSWLQRVVMAPLHVAMNQWSRKHDPYTVDTEATWQINSVEGIGARNAVQLFCVPKQVQALCSATKTTWQYRNRENFHHPTEICLNSQFTDY